MWWLRIVGLLVSTAAALVTLITAPAIDAVIVGILVAILTLLIDLVLSFERERSILLEEAALSKSVSRASPLHSPFCTIADGIADLTVKGDKLFTQQACNKVEECKEFVEGLVGGEATMNEENRMGIIRDMIRVTQANRDRIRATSYVEVDRWWDLPLGKAYEEDNIAAAHRGVTLSRIFIVRAGERDAVRPLAERQSKGQVHVKLIDENDVLAENRQDFVLFNKNYVSYTEVDKDLNPTRGHISTHVKRFESIYEQLDLRAKELVDYFV